MARLRTLRHCHGRGAEITARRSVSKQLSGSRRRPQTIMERSPFRASWVANSEKNPPTHIVRDSPHEMAHPVVVRRHLPCVIRWRDRLDGQACRATPRPGMDGRNGGGTLGNTIHPKRQWILVPSCRAVRRQRQAVPEMKILIIALNITLGNVLLSTIVLKSFPETDKIGFYAAFNLTAVAVLWKSLAFLENANRAYSFWKCIALGIGGSLLISFVGTALILNLAMKSDDSKSINLIAFFLARLVPPILAMFPAVVFWGPLGVLNGTLFFLKAKYF